MGSGAKGHNFVFARVSPTKEAEVSDEVKEEVKPRPRRSQPPAKKPRVSRTLDENSEGTIFNLL